MHGDLAYVNECAAMPLVDLDKPITEAYSEPLQTSKMECLCVSS